MFYNLLVSTNDRESITSIDLGLQVNFRVSVSLHMQDP